jgi:hypothetical protein
LLPPAKELNQARKSAGLALNPKRASKGDFGDLHETSARLMSFTKEWEHKIEPWLKRSKAARSFLLPLLVLAVFRYRFPNYDSPFERSLLSPLGRWEWDAVLFAVALSAYIWWRLTHMRRLYELTSSAIRPVSEGGNFRATYLIPEKEVPYLCCGTAAKL